MRTVEFRRFFDDQTATRVLFDAERGRILKFVVQLECLVREEWHAIVRYDTAHGFAHRDLMHPTGKTEKQEIPVSDYNEALTYAINDLSENWEKYRRRYVEWLNLKSTR